MVDIKSIIDNVLKQIVGEYNENTRIIKIHTYNLNGYGELSFPMMLSSWKYSMKDVIKDTNENILGYYLKRHHVDVTNYHELDIKKMAQDLLILLSRLWTVPIAKVGVRYERVHLFLNRTCVLENIIILIIKEGKEYGQLKTNGKSIYFTVNEDPKSNVTTARLHQIKNICQNILILQGYNVVKNNADYKYRLTIKSNEKNTDEIYHRYICGVVRHPTYYHKITDLNYDTYVQRKINILNLYDDFGDFDSDDRQKTMKKIAEATITFEFLSAKPHKPIFANSIENPQKTTKNNNRGSEYVLYNMARITSLLNKFDKDQLSGKYPELSKPKFIYYRELELEEEWELVYNFLLGYPQLIMNSIVEQNTKHEFRPDMVCAFLLNLSKKFSTYYRRHKILTDGAEHLIQKMFARLYLLKALQIVMKNALEILNIEPISRM